LIAADASSVGNYGCKAFPRRHFSSPGAKDLSSGGWHNRLYNAHDPSRLWYRRGIGRGTSSAIPGCAPRRSVFLEEDAPARGVNRHGEVGEDSRAEESGFAGEKLPCVKACLHTVDSVVGEIDNCIDIGDRPT
jgi:hypothetical protein